MPAPERNERAEFVTVAIAMKKLNLCRASTVKLAKEADALYRYGNSQRIRWDRLKEYFEKEYAEKDERS